jgi:hypothetical protein
MASDKDRMGDKLRDKERAEEDRFFQERDRQALEKLRAKGAEAEAQELRELVRDRCPRGGDRRLPVELPGVTVDAGPAGHGLWADQGELEAIAKRERDSWFGRFFFRPRR